MNTLDKLEELSTEHGWEFSLHPYGKFLIVRESDIGYPYKIWGKVTGPVMEEGELEIDYGSGPEAFNVGTRYIKGVLTNRRNPLKYKTFLDAFNASNPLERSEKAIADRVGHSERQIRKARICGYVDPYMLDDLCWKLLNLHPAVLYGMDAWIEGTDLDFDLDEVWKEMEDVDS